jgi:transcriptional regulator with XRE-family HTH domain
MRLTKNELAAQVGKRIRELRHQKNISMESLAYAAGIEYAQLSRIELGKINTSVYQLYLLAEILERPLADFFELEPAMK